MILEILGVLAFLTLVLVPFYLGAKLIIAGKIKKQKPNEASQSPFITMIILGSGGHTMEMLTIASKLDGNMYSPRVYVMAKTDGLSYGKVVKAESSRGDGDSAYVFVKRIREVGQSRITTLLWSAPYAFCQAEWWIRFYAPSIIICNGPGICVPFIIFARLYRALFRYKCALVYVESICRVEKLSLTGRIVHPMVDHFFVQWPELKQKGDIFLGRIS